MKAFLAALSLLIAVPEAVHAYDTGNCPVQQLACNVTTHSTLAAPDCRNVGYVFIHMYSFIGNVGDQISLATDITPFVAPLLSLYGPGDATPAARSSILDTISISAASIPPFRIDRPGVWNVLVTTIDPTAIYIDHLDTTTMTCQVAYVPPPPIPPRRRAAKH